MGIDTVLLLSSRWELDDLKTVVEKWLETKVKVRDCSKTSVGMFYFNFKFAGELRSMCIFVNHVSNLGACTCLSLSHDKQSVEIMTKIAKVFGGFFMENDSVGKYEQIDGMFSEGDGLNYFLKYAIVNNELVDENDLRGLNESIHKWHDRVRTSMKDMKLFPRERAQ